MKTFTRNFIVYFLLIAQCFCVNFVNAQSRIVSTIEKESGNATTGYGRDFWFAIPQNYDPTQNQQKYFQVSVAAFHNTTVNFQVGSNTVVQRSVIAGQVTIIQSPTSKSPFGDISINTEIHTSGVVETKSIHLWSNDEDLSVCFLSRAPFSSDGMYVIPSSGWGKEYVVGGYSSLLTSSKTDLPSEFAVVANQNNTTLTIIPSADLRKDGFPNIIDHPKGISFTQNLNRGECIQYQVTGSPQDDSWDVTGTVITSNNPVGVMGASAAPFIPASDPYSDYILDMLQPIRSWSNTYFTAPFAGRKFGGDAFLVIGTRNGQIIFRNGAQVAILNKYQNIFLYDVTDPSYWTSDNPFMLVQYVEGSTHDAPNINTRNAGDPSMVVMNGSSQFRKDILFQSPRIDIATGQTGFTNYVNVLLPVDHEGKTFYDGHPIGGPIWSASIQLKERIPIPNTSWEAIRITYKIGVGEGVHRITSDTGIGVYVYGFGSDDSYAWSGNLGIVITNSIDSIPPAATESGNCFSLHVTANDILASDSKLGSIVTDTIFNMSFTLDPNFTPGAGIGTSFYDLHVVDSTNEAYARIYIYDLAGNRTAVTSIYKPQFVKFSFNPLNFGVVSVGNFSFLYDTICNTGELPFHFKKANLTLSNGTQIDDFGFSIDSAGADGDIPVGGCRIIKIHFIPHAPPTVRDTMVIADTCSKIICPLLGNGGVPDFSLSDFDFGCIDLGKTKRVDATVASNFGAGAITIDSIWTEDAVHFTFSGTPKLPATIKVNDQIPFQFTFAPTTKDTVCTRVHFRSNEAGERTAKLCGCTQVPVSVEMNSYSSLLSKGSTEYSSISAKLDHGDDLAILPPVPNPLTHGENTIRFVYGLKYDSPLDLSICDILGNHVSTVVHEGFQPAGIYEIHFPIGVNIPSGSYIYRLFGAGKVISGKLVIVK